MNEKKHMMTSDQFDRELKYQTIMAIMRQMQKEGIVDDDDIDAVNEKMIEKYHPLIGGLTSKRFPKWEEPTQTIFIDENGNERIVEP